MRGHPSLEPSPEQETMPGEAAMTTKPWIIYTRVSTEEQAQTGISLDAQWAACRAHATSRGLTVAHEVSDPGASASTLKRPGMQQVIGHLREGQVAGVIVWRLDRATRSLRDLCVLLDLCKESKTGLVSVMETLDTSSAMGMFVVHLLGAIAQWERETIGQRTRSAMQHAAREGFYTGAPAPAGVRVEAVEGGRRKLVRDHNADLVAEIWPAILGGASLRDVARRLTDAGVCSPLHAKRGKHGPWSISAVRALVLSPRVVGLLVDAATQERVRATLAARANPQRRGEGSCNLTPSPTSSPLTGLFRCPSCGGAVVNVTATGRGGAYRYLRCSNRGKGTCRQKDLRTDRLEAAVYATLADLCSAGGDYHQHLVRELAEARGRLDTVKVEALQLRSEREQLSARVADLVLRQQIGTPFWTEAMQVLNGKLESCDRRLAELQGVLSAATMEERDVDAMMSYISRSMAALPGLPLEEQRLTLRLLVERMTIAGDELVVSLRFSGHQGALPPVSGGEVRRIAQSGDPNGARTRDLKSHNLAL